MNIIIGEANQKSAQRLKSLLMQVAPDGVVRGVFQSTREISRVIRSGVSADLLLLNTDLADGKSFKVFSAARDIPVIFFSSDSEDAVEAYRYHTIGYLRKPVKASPLKESIEKYRRISKSSSLPTQELSTFKNLIDAGQQSYRERFIIKTGNKIQFKTVSDVAMFFAEGKTAYLVSRTENRKFIIDHTLEELERSLDPKIFFRISRKYIVSVDCIGEIRGLISGKLSIKLTQHCEHDLTVSRERSQKFKQWLNR